MAKKFNVSVMGMIGIVVFALILAFGVVNAVILFSMLEDSLRNLLISVVIMVIIGFGGLSYFAKFNRRKRK